MPRFIGIFFLLLLSGSAAYAQVASDCGNAIAICNNTPVNGAINGFGKDDFNGAAVSGCLEQTLDGSIESNSAWYRFRTGASGQLGFNIGISMDEDWDFALYKTDDCHKLGEPVRCNFFDNQEANSFVGVGKDPTGRMDNVQYEDWLQVEAGENYYLFINNFSNSNSGFSVQFSGNIFVSHPNDALDCSLIDNLLGPPVSACEGNPVLLDATTSYATNYNWFTDTGSGFIPITGENDATLNVNASAQYRVEVLRPSGSIISEVQVAFSEVPVAHPIGDKASCSGFDVVELSQIDAEVLGNQSSQKFVVSYHASLADATNGIHALANPHPTHLGTETIYVRVGPIDNPRCFDVSQSFRLINLKTPVLDFPQIAYLCEIDSGIFLGPEHPHSGYTYEWDSGETTPNIEVTQAGQYTLTVTNTQSGLSCSDSRTVTVIASEPPTITDIEIEDLSNHNTITVLAAGPTPLNTVWTMGPTKRLTNFITYCPVGTASP